MGILETLVTEGASGRRIRVVRGDYSFAADGGAIGTINLVGNTVIPSGAIIIGGYIDVTTQCTSGGAATIALAVQSAGDIVPNTVAIGAWTTGLKKVAPELTGAVDLSASEVVRTTAAKDIVMTIATAALTAGAFEVVLYVMDPLA